MIKLITYLLTFLFTLGATIYSYRSYSMLKGKQSLWMALTFGSATVLRGMHIINYYYDLGIAPDIAGLFIIVWFFGLLGARGIYRSIKEVLRSSTKNSSSWPE